MSTTTPTGDGVSAVPPGLPDEAVLARLANEFFLEIPGQESPGQEIAGREIPAELGGAPGYQPATVPADLGGARPEWHGQSFVLLGASPARLRRASTRR